MRKVQRTPSFPLHNKNAKALLFSYKLCKSSLKEDEVAVCVDFAKNYVYRTKKEAHSLYHSRDSMTVHPMVVVFPQGEEISRLYFDVISDNLKHGSAVNVFLNRLASHLSTNYPHVKYLHNGLMDAGFRIKAGSQC